MEQTGGGTATRAGEPDIDDNVSRSKYYYWANIDHYREKAKFFAAKKRRANRQAVLHFYSDGKMCCACCGEDHEVFLAIDHINGDGNTERRSEHPENKNRMRGGSGGFYHSLIKRGYPAGYQVLCHNCNYAKHLLGVCPHEFEGDPK